MTASVSQARAITDIEAQRIRNGELIGMCFELHRHPEQRATPMFLHLNELWLQGSLTPEHFYDDHLVANALSWFLQEPRNPETRSWVKGGNWYKVGMCALVFRDISASDALLVSTMPKLSLNKPFKQFGLEVLERSFSDKVYRTEPMVVNFERWKTR